MRLLECTLNPDNDEITVKPTEYGDLETPEYAILSHRWREEEVEYQHMVSGSDYTLKRGYKKIEDSASVAEKMSWAASRETTRVEDVAYSLLGLFSVNMPTLYGEGLRAFRRLQLEIMQNSNDHTLFAWDDSTCSGDMLASSPKQFSGKNNLQPIPYSEYIARFSIASPKPDYGLTNAGLHIQLPMIPNPRSTTGGYIAFLACTRVDPVNRYFAVIYLERTEEPSFNGFHRVAFRGVTTSEERNPNFRTYASETIWVSKKVVYQVSKEYVPSRILTPMEAGGSSEGRLRKRTSGIGQAWGNIRRNSTVHLRRRLTVDFGRAKN
ncbi:uncharacterized protein N0V89_007822 [Didymosphaeria variabile]|uniref:DUF8212 domain-containing protein n=1 Tax=Didymosphaeria variabile TaxID=1932322 RepID=A0A9W8XJV1_9PLEO|nr:uncharacterized protein N0V89_007822 [Didymosphaeria variabile]KAJ4352474.1 hypothetical protein N0V89_007822 [Didymosphaeria variabile]